MQKNCKLHIDTNIVREGQSPKTFIRDMEWKFALQRQYLKLQISFVDYKGSNYLKASSQRLKLQLMILLRIVNENLSNQQRFVIHPANGLLVYHFQISWKQYKIKVPKIQSLRRFLSYVVSQINKFRQIIYFCQPKAKIDIAKDNYERIHLFDNFLKYTNNYRYALKNTKNLRQQNISIMGKLQQLRGNKAKNQYQKNMMDDQIRHLQIVFQQNVNTLYQGIIGLEETAQNQEIKRKCKSNIAKHQNYFQKPFKNQKQDQIIQQSETKIVQGLLVIKKSQQNIISKKGAHSQITEGKLIYKLVGTINKQVMVSQSQKDKWISKSDKKATFTIKRCRTTLEPSRNSFMNQIYFLNYVRNNHCSFIGRYYLKIKNLKQRSQKDQIYMKPYSHNIDELLRACKTLTIKQRLSMIYQISLGLCFLNTKNVIHRDLKPQNIVINPSLVPHIIDFGSCCSSYGSNSFNSFDKRLLTTKAIHVAFHEIPQAYSYIYNKMSKQQYQQHPLFDIYSFGKVISFIMFHSFTPPNFQQVSNDPYSQILTNVIFLIQMCLNIDPDERPGFGQITGFIGSLGKFYNQFQSYVWGKQTNQQQKMPQQNSKNMRNQSQ